MLRFIDNLVNIAVGIGESIPNAVESFFKSDKELQKRILMIIMGLILFIVYIRWWIWGEGLI